MTKKHQLKQTMINILKRLFAKRSKNTKLHGEYLEVMCPLYAFQCGYITPGKVYTGYTNNIVGYNNSIAFRIENDNGAMVWCLLKDCPHIETDWIIIKRTNKEVYEGIRNTEIQ